MIVYSDRYSLHNLDGHPENRERLISTMDLLRERNVFKKIPLVKPVQAHEDDILRVHSRTHLSEMMANANCVTKVLGDTYFTDSTYEAALLAAGGVIKCIEANNKSAFALVRPPGHHATRDRAMGFCIFNNAAVGAAFAKENGHSRIAILDFDLHHGNGTQDILYEDDILYMSLHQAPHYPGTGLITEIGRGKGEGYTVNIPLPDGTCDKSYDLALEEIIYPVLRSFSPNLLIISAGYDGHYKDPLGNLNLSSISYLNISRNIRKICKKNVFTLEGGYDLSALSNCVHASLQGLFDLEGDLLDQSQQEQNRVSEIVEERIKKIKSIISEYWNI